MLAETDQALATLTREKVLGGAQIAVAFDPPSRPWIQALTAPTVNFFLFDLRENTHHRDEGFTEVRDANGKLTERRPPMPRWDLHYTVSVFAPQIIVEHRVLAAVLRYFAQLKVLPPESLPPALAETGYPVLVSTGSGPKRSMFLNYAGDMKAGFEMAVTVPIPPYPPPPLPPPVLEPPVIHVEPMPGADAARAASPSETVQARPPEASAAPPAAGPAAPESPAPAAAGTEPAPDAPDAPAKAPRKSSAKAKTPAEGGEA